MPVRIDRPFSLAFSMSDNSPQIVQRLWDFCDLLRDDGVSYGDYVEQLTYLLFLKMDQERRDYLNEASAPQSRPFGTTVNAQEQGKNCELSNVRLGKPIPYETTTTPAFAVERACYDIELRDFDNAPGTIDAVALRDLLDALIGASEKALRLALEGVEYPPWSQTRLADRLRPLSDYRPPRRLHHFSRSGSSSS